MWFNWNKIKTVDSRSFCLLFTINIWKNPSSAVNKHPGWLGVVCSLTSNSGDSFGLGTFCGDSSAPLLPLTAMKAGKCQAENDVPQTHLWSFNFKWFWYLNKITWFTEYKCICQQFHLVSIDHHFAIPTSMKDNMAQVINHVTIVIWKSSL